MKKKIRKVALIFALCFMICGCESSQSEVVKQVPELKDFYLSATISKQVVDSDDVLFENRMYDFSKDEVTYHQPQKRRSQYALAVYDMQWNSILYTANDESNANDQVFCLNLETEESTKLTTGFYAINYILPREKDILIVGAKDSRVLEFMKIDRESKRNEKITIPHEEYNDLSVWQAYYVPQTGDILIQTYSESQQYRLMEEWNNADPGTRDTDLLVPFQHYLYKENGSLEYLFTKKMEQSTGLISNGKDILMNVESTEFGKKIWKYNIEKETFDVIDTLDTLQGIFYLDTKGENVYAFYKGIYRMNLITGEEESIESSFKSTSFYNNHMVLKK